MREAESGSIGIERLTPPVSDADVRRSLRASRRGRRFRCRRELPGRSDRRARAGMVARLDLFRLPALRLPRRARRWTDRRHRSAPPGMGAEPAAPRRDREAARRSAHVGRYPAQLHLPEKKIPRARPSATPLACPPPRRCRSGGRFASRDPVFTEPLRRPANGLVESVISIARSIDWTAPVSDPRLSRKPQSPSSAVLRHQPGPLERARRLGPNKSARRRSCRLRTARPPQ